MDVLVIDIGGSSVKMTASGASDSRRFKSGATLTPVEFTGVGSSLITEHVIIHLELGCLFLGTATVVERLGQPALDTHGVRRWNRDVAKATRMLRAAFAADYVLLGGGNARKVIPLPEGTRRGGNTQAFKGGFRLWEETMEPHDRTPPPVWRVVR